MQYMDVMIDAGAIDTRQDMPIIIGALHHAAHLSPVS